MSSREFKFSDQQFSVSDLGNELNVPLKKEWFTKLPEGMEPQIWLRMKMIVMMNCPPNPMLSDYGISIHDKFWSLRQLKDSNYMLTFHLKHGDAALQLSAAVIFAGHAVAKSKSGKGYHLKMLKYSMWDVEHSQRVDIRLTANPI